MFLFCSIFFMVYANKKSLQMFSHSKTLTWARGFEPPTFWSVAKRSIQLS